jgi:hypothetical protein
VLSSALQVGEEQQQLARVQPPRVLRPALVVAKDDEQQLVRRRRSVVRGARRRAPGLRALEHVLDRGAELGGFTPVEQLRAAARLTREPEQLRRTRARVKLIAAGVLGGGAHASGFRPARGVSCPVSQFPL